MIEVLKPYVETRHIALPWLSKIPAHWRVQRAKSLLRSIDARSTSGAEELLTVSSRHGVIPRSTTSVTMFKAESYVGYKLCWPGDLVINSLWAWGRGLGVADQHGIVSSAYGVYRTRSTNVLNPRYLHHLVRSDAFQWELQVRSRGIWISRLQLTDEAFLGAPLLVPPLEEQAAIVRFLGHIDRRIRLYIRAKQKLVKLLEEQRRSVIEDVVTRGLDLEKCLASSGTSWVGDLPEHWRLATLGNCLRKIEQGWSPRAAEGDWAEGQWGVLTLSAVRRGNFDGQAVKPIPMSSEVPEELEVRSGDVLLTRSNTRQLVGDICVVDEVRPRTIFSDLIYRLRVKDAVLNPRYLGYLLQAPFGRVQIEQDARGASGTMPKISQSHIKSWRVLLPPIEEQSELVELLDRRLSSIRAAIHSAETEIELLIEYQRRLVADVVIGNLDVRAAAARLPDESEQPAAPESVEPLLALGEIGEIDLDDALAEAEA